MEKAITPNITANTIGRGLYSSLTDHVVKIINSRINNIIMNISIHFLCYS